MDTKMHLPNAEGRIDMKLPKDGIDLKTLLRGLQKSLIRQALERTAQNGQEASNLLGITRASLVDMRRRLGFPLDDKWKKETLRPRKFRKSQGKEQAEASGA